MDSRINDLLENAWVRLGIARQEELLLIASALKLATHVPRDYALMHVLLEDGVTSEESLARFVRLGFIVITDGKIFFSRSEIRDFLASRKEMQGSPESGSLL